MVCCALPSPLHALPPRRPLTFPLEAGQLVDTLTLQVPLPTHSGERGKDGTVPNRGYSQVEANYGHPDYTCIYRIMVHGQVQEVHEEVHEEVQEVVRGEEVQGEEVQVHSHSEEVLVV